MKNKESVYLGIDVGGTNTRIGLVNKKLSLFGVEKYPTENIDLEEVIITYLNKYRREYRIKKIAIGFPGIVNNVTKELINIPNAKHLESNVLIKNIINKTNKDVLILRDVNSLLSYDLYDLKLNNQKNVLAFYIGTGFGLALKLNNQIYFGDNMVSGEIGHIPFFNNVKCGCGKTTCLEAKASGSYLVNLINTHFTNTKIEDIFIKHHEDVLLIEFIDKIARAIASVLIILDIKTIIIGGGVVSMNNFPQKELSDKIKYYLHGNESKRNLRIYFQNNKIDSGIIGSYLYAKNIL